jgi:hypothetical protein
MRDANRSRFSPELNRAIIGTIIWMGIGLLAFNVASTRRILECDRTSGQVQCQLSTKQLLGKTRVPEFTTAKLQKAIVGEHQGPRMFRDSRRVKRYTTIYQIDLVTDQGTFSLTANDMAHPEKYRLVASINAFLESPQIPTLQVEDVYQGTIMRIVTGIFLGIWNLLLLGIFITLRFPNNSTPPSEVLQQLWGENLENFDRGGEHHRHVQIPAPDQSLSPKIDHHSDS